MKKIKDKLRKVLELVKNGEPGEREAAQIALDKLLTKHDLTLDDIALPEKTLEYYEPEKGSEYYWQLLCQTVVTVVNDMSIDTYRPRNTRKKIVGVYVTKAQDIDIRLRYNLYHRSLSNHFKMMYDAFLNKNMIYPDQLKSGNNDEPQKPISLEEHQKMMQMYEAVDRVNVRNQLGTGG